VHTTCRKKTFALSKWSGKPLEPGTEMYAFAVVVP